MKVETTLKVSTVLMLLAMAAVVVIPYVIDVRVNSSVANVVTALNQERQYETLLDMLRDAETGQRGFIITGNEEYLKPHTIAAGVIPATIEGLRGLITDATELESLRKIELLVDEKLNRMARHIQLRRQLGMEAAAASVSNGRGKELMDQLRVLVGDKIHQHAAQRAVLREQLLSDARLGARLATIATVANLAALLTMLLASYAALRKSRRAEQDATCAAAALQYSAQQTARHNDQLAETAEMMNALDLAETLDEASMIISRYFVRLLPGLSGSLYLYRNSRDILERKAVWGDDSGDPEVLEKLDCWGLRRGGQYFSPDAHALHCRHVTAAQQAVPRQCLPLVAQDEVVGCITVTGPELAGEGGEDLRRGILHLSEQVALSLSNVQLRLMLRRQSIIDPLTELYNRRYMDESLKRELARSQRKAAPLALVLVDLDHFKRVNDTHGHEAGDLLLRKVGQVLRNNVRACDIACRFGGEELVLVLPDCDLEAGMVRAEAVRLAIAAIEFGSKGVPCPVSASLGVASTVEHGDSAEALLRAADVALYTAKQTGRNRVVPARALGHGEAAHAPVTA